MNDLMGKRAALLALALLAVTVRAADDFKVEEGFKSLFDGKDLTGWKIGKKGTDALDGKTDAADGRFEVKDGIIIVNAKDKNGKCGVKDLYTVKEFGKDFILKL